MVCRVRSRHSVYATASNDVGYAKYGDVGMHRLYDARHLLRM